VLFNLPPGNWDAGERGIASLPGREAEFQAGVATALAYAKALGTPRLHAMAGLLPEGADRNAYLDRYVENLRYAARQLAQHGLTLLIEPINGRDMPGYLLQTQTEAHAVRERVGEANLKVQMDLYHAQIMGGDLSATLRRYIGHVGHIQVAGVPDRHEPDQGELNVKHLFGLLDELGYQGWVGCEYRPLGKTQDGLQWIREFQPSQEKKT
jgi:hydroxypyruvate isomerase